MKAIALTFDPDIILERVGSRSTGLTHDEPEKRLSAFNNPFNILLTFSR